MKKIGIVFLTLLMVTSTMNAEVEFAYEAGAEVVSAYLWRGQYNGGLSLQPNVSIGFEGEKTSLSVGAWGNIGASDWKFVSKLPKTDDYNPNTYFVPELDIYVMFNIYGLVQAQCRSSRSAKTISIAQIKIMVFGCTIVRTECRQNVKIEPVNIEFCCFYIKVIKLL